MTMRAAALLLLFSAQPALGNDSAPAVVPLKQSERSWMTTLRDAPPETRAKAVLEKMHLDEKLAMLHGADKEFDNGSLHGSRYVGNVMGNRRLGIPRLNLNDGPQGFRGRVPGISTAWPAALSVAASWSRDTMFQWGQAMGQEFREHGANVQLGPGVCVARVPTNGRNVCARTDLTASTTTLIAQQKDTVSEVNCS